jgi:menaquinone-dependent protoporphyrinogen oxidase
MASRILVAYASRHGSTAGVAEAVGKTLSESALQVDVRQVSDVVDLEPYAAVVMGSAIRGGKWLPEAMDFVHAHQVALARKPFAAFLVCATMGSPNAQYRQGVAAWMAPVRDLVRPMSEGLFAGNLDLGKMPFGKDALMFRVAVAMGALPGGDRRDWDAVRTWAQGLVPLLCPVAQVR